MMIHNDEKVRLLCRAFFANIAETLTTKSKYIEVLVVLCYNMNIHMKQRSFAISYAVMKQSAQK